MSLSIPGFGGRVPTWLRQHSPQSPPGGMPNASVGEAQPADEVTTSPAVGEAARSGIAAAHQAIQLAEEGMALVSAARHGLESVHARLGRMAATLHAARDRAGSGAAGGPTWEEVLGAMQSDAEAIDRIAAETRCGGMQLLDG